MTELGELAVALDATPLLGQPTGVGAFCAGALGALAGRPELRTSAFAVSWRRRHGIVTEVPAGVTVTDRAMPARPLHLAWRRLGWPPAEWFVGPVDVVHGTNFVVPPTRRAGAVVTVHDLTTLRYPELCDPSTLVFPELIRRALGRGAFVHTPSSFVAAEVIEAFGADPERVRAVHSGVPAAPTGTGPAATTGVALPGRPYLLAVGTAEPRKDLPGLVAAFNRLAPAQPELDLVLAGPKGWGEAALTSALADSPHSARVRRLGWVDAAALDRLRRGAVALVYPSLYEGFGFPPLEAMAAGVPVVSTTAGALPEVLGDAALLVPPGDPEALADALAQVAGSAACRAALVSRGRARVAQFSWERCANGLASLYREAADAR